MTVAVAELCGESQGSANVTAAAAECISKPKVKVKGVSLLPHESALLAQKLLSDITHQGSSSVWLSAPSDKLIDPLYALLYRPMGDTELLFLLEKGVLPDTQPYQTIVEGSNGRKYAEKYLKGHKSVDSSPTTVVEFNVPRSLVTTLFQMQTKVTHQPSPCAICKLV